MQPGLFQKRADGCQSSVVEVQVRWDIYRSDVTMAFESI